METNNAIIPGGVYLHKGGGKYTVLCIAKDSTNAQARRPRPYGRGTGFTKS